MVRYRLRSAEAKAAPVRKGDLERVIATVETSNTTMEFDALGRISQVYLKDRQYRDEEGEELKLFNTPKIPKPLEIRFSDQSLNELAFKTPYTVSVSSVEVKGTPETITFRQNLDGLIVEKVVTIFPDHHAKGTESFRKARIAVAFDRYYATSFYDFDQGLNVVVNKDAEENPVLFVSGESDRVIHGYIGPKEHRILQAIHPELTKKDNRVRMVHVHSSTHVQSATVKEIQAKYKGDPQKMNAHMMELYKKHKANPLGGCLPMLLQIPVFFAIYRVLLNAIELKGAEWILWIDDLSVMDPYYVLPILMGASMWAHQMVTPNNFTDPMQEKIFKWLPVIFTFFFVTFPAGLVLYWLVNNIFSIAQQLLINKMLEKNKKAE